MTFDNPKYNARIEELELKITFQDDLIEKLNESLITQQNDIRKLTQLIEKMSNEVQSIKEDNVVDISQDQRPPHY